MTREEEIMNIRIEINLLKMAISKAEERLAEFRDRLVQLGANPDAP